MENLVNWFVNADTPVKIIITIFVLFFTSIAIVGFLKSLKGSVKINLDKLSHELGDNVSGSIEVISKKDQKCNEITVNLVCKKITKSRDSKGRTRTRSHVVFENKVRVSKATQLMASSRPQSFNFSINTPDKSEQDKVEGPEFGDSFWGKLVKLAGPPTKLEWYVEANVDLDGLDIGRKEQVFFNLIDF